MSNVKYFLFNTIEEFKAFDKCFHSIFQNTDGSLKFPYQKGTIGYLSAMAGKDSNGYLTCVKNDAFDEISKGGCLNNYFQNEITFEEAKSLGFFKSTFLLKGA